MLYDFNLNRCCACPRQCGADRTKEKGFCGLGDKIRIARAAPHYWEEPCISGQNGSGTVFFSGCNLGCAFCQNYEISSGCFGKDVSETRFREILFELKSKGVHNINLVTATPQLPLILPVLSEVKEQLFIPVVYNTGGYEKKTTVEALQDIVDVWLPDMKFFDPDVALKFADAPDYPLIALDAIEKMLENAGNIVIEDGLIKSGVIVRHLVLPGYRKDSINVLKSLSDRFGTKGYYLSLMSQYTPNKSKGTPVRRLTSYEYESVKDVALSLGFEGYFQEKSSAKEEYVPPFDLEGV